MRTRTAMLAVLLALVTSALAALAAEPLQVAALPIAPPELAYELAGEYVAAGKGLVAVTACKGFSDLEAGLKAGKFDLVFGACPASSTELKARELVEPEGEVILYYLRQTMFLPPGNPLGIMRAADLEREGLRIGLVTLRTTGPLADKLRGRALVVSGDQGLLLDLLEEGRLDVVVGLDALGRPRPHLVTIRLPRSVAGEGAAVAGRGLIARATPRRAAAAAFLEFCQSHEARKIMTARAVMTEDGSDAASYSEGASSQMMFAYQGLAKQIALDYAPGARNCLDLGCGPGEMTVEVAKATGLEVHGLDIEPECIDLAEEYARKAGVADRMRWVAADVHALPYPDNSFDIVISRGSIFFWRDQVTALREVMRVLRPGGWALIGGGWGRLVSKSEWEKARPGVDPNTAAELYHFPWPLKNVPALMARAGINDYRHITEGGMWIEFRKPPAAR